MEEKISVASSRFVFAKHCHLGYGRTIESMSERPNTLQARLGFQDSDHQKPLHDEIVRWADENIDDLLMIGLTLPYRPNARVTWEATVKSRGRFGGPIIGFVDLLATWRDPTEPLGSDFLNCAIEVKTEIPSLGELIRQLRLYQDGEMERVRGINHWLVVAPDDAHAAKLREQHIRFFKYKPGYYFANVGGV